MRNPLSPVNDLDEKQKRWFAVYTKYKSEKYVIKHLLKKGVTAYTPLIKTTKRYVRKVKTYEVPLLNCYVFVCIDKSQYIKVLETEYVLNFVKIRKNLVAIPEAEIDLLKRIVGEFQNITVATEDYKIGDSVEIISGNLTGLKGHLVEINGKHDLLINLDKSGFQLLINIDPKLVRVLNEI